jgi:hypothetical protein
MTSISCAKIILPKRPAEIGYVLLILPLRHPFPDSFTPYTLIHSARAHTANILRRSLNSTSARLLLVCASAALWDNPSTLFRLWHGAPTELGFFLRKPLRCLSIAQYSPEVGRLS